MNNFEAKYTIRIYDAELYMDIENLYQKHMREFGTKNAFMTYLIRLGIDSLNSKPPAAPASAAIPPIAALDRLYDEIQKLESISDETSKYLRVQGKNMEAHIAIMEKLLASIYNIKFGEISGSPPIPRKVEDGFFDDLPARFAKIILTLEQQIGNK